MTQLFYGLCFSSASRFAVPYFSPRFLGFCSTMEGYNDYGNVTTLLCGLVIPALSRRLDLGGG